MRLKELRDIIKGQPGTLPVMIPDGKGGYVEASTARVEELEMEDYEDEECLILDE